MKKLYSKKSSSSSSSNKGANKKRVHPSPSLSSSLLISFLPAAALALASTLSPDDQQVLAYLLACCDYKNDHPHPHHHDSTNTSKSAKNHSPELGCSCFGCYTSFWVRWDSSPNRRVIHAILDAFEESLETKEPTMLKGMIKEKRSSENKQEDGVVLEAVGEKPDEYDRDDGNGEEGETLEEEEGRSSVMRFVSWVFGINNN